MHEVRVEHQIAHGAPLLVRFMQQTRSSFSTATVSICTGTGSGRTASSFTAARTPPDFLSQGFPPLLSCTSFLRRGPPPNALATPNPPQTTHKGQTARPPEVGSSCEVRVFWPQEPKSPPQVPRAQEPVWRLCFGYTLPTRLSAN